VGATHIVAEHRAGTRSRAFQRAVANRRGLLDDYSHVRNGQGHVDSRFLRGGLVEQAANHAAVIAS
jgi:hypothetical protein